MATATNIHGFNIGGNNNSFDQRGHFYRGVFSGNVTGMLVKQNSTPNMTVLVEHGSALLNKNTTSASIAEIKSDTSVAIDTANTSNPRIDTVVIYEDTSVAIPTVEANYWQDGAGGRFKIVSLPGTAGASPVALSDANIQTAIGAGKPFTRLGDITIPANSTTIVNSNISDTRVILSTETTGVIKQYAGSTAPNGYLLCQGQAVSRTTYAALFSAIGTTYGTGDNSTTFNLPNMKGRVPVGLDTSDTDFNILGKTGGQKTVQQHSHDSYIDRSGSRTVVTAANGGGTVQAGFFTNIGGTTFTGQAVQSGTAGTGVNNMNPYLSLNYIIKT